MRPDDNANMSRESSARDAATEEERLVLSASNSAADTNSNATDSVNSTDLDIDQLDDAILVGPAAYDQSSSAPTDSDGADADTSGIDPVVTGEDAEVVEGSDGDPNGDTLQPEDVTGGDPTVTNTAASGDPPADATNTASVSESGSNKDVAAEGEGEGGDEGEGEEEEPALVDMPMIGGQNKSTHPMQPSPPGLYDNCTDIGGDNSTNRTIGGSVVDCSDMVPSPVQPTPSPTPTAFANRHNHNKRPTHRDPARNKGAAASHGGKVGAGIGVAPKSTLAEDEKEDVVAGAALMAVAVVVVLVVVLVAIRRRRSFAERGVQMSQVVSDRELHLDVTPGSGSVLGHGLDSSVGGGGSPSSRKNGRRRERGSMDTSDKVAYAPPAKGGVARGPYESYNELI